jgi:uncharacterized membrane protein YoaK (UPF0700 family)
VIGLFGVETILLPYHKILWPDLNLAQIGQDDDRVRIASVDDSLATKVLPFVLSIIAGSTDTIGFLGLNGLFTAHITGNLVFLVARLVAGEQAPISYFIAVPVFMVAVMTTNIALWIIDAAEIFLGQNASSVANARSRAKHTWPAILGFLIGCALGGACEAALGLKSVVLPTSLALLAVGLGLAPYSAPRRN